MKGLSKLSLISYVIILLFVSCSEKENLNIVNQLFIDNINLTNALNIDNNSRLKSKEVYAESYMAMHEIYQIKTDKLGSINNQIIGFTKITTSKKNINYDFSSLVAFYEVIALNSIKSTSIEFQKTKIFNYYKKELFSIKYKNSLEFGSLIAKTIVKNFRNHKGFFIVKDIDELGYNHPKNFKNIPKPELINNAKELIKINNNLTDFQKFICNYWEGNDEKGIKKINIEAHWFSILTQKLSKSNLPIEEITKIYAMLGLTIYEAYKIGEYEEYTNTFSTPKDIIEKNINKNWSPFLKNSFKEYNSTSSIVSLSASKIISNFIKPDTTFVDSSIFKYIGYSKKFNSLEEAASEASISRAYGGLHFIFIVNDAAEQGKILANKILIKIK